MCNIYAADCTIFTRIVPVKNAQHVTKSRRDEESCSETSSGYDESSDPMKCVSPTDKALN